MTEIKWENHDIVAFVTSDIALADLSGVIACPYDGRPMHLVAVWEKTGAKMYQDLEIERDSLAYIVYEDNENGRIVAHLTHPMNWPSRERYELWKAEVLAGKIKHYFKRSERRSCKMSISIPFMEAMTKGTGFGGIDFEYLASLSTGHLWNQIIATMEQSGGPEGYPVRKVRAMALVAELESREGFKIPQRGKRAQAWDWLQRSINR